MQQLFHTREEACTRAFNDHRPFFIITTAALPWLMFTDEDEFKAGTNGIAYSVVKSGICMLMDVQMHNHMHFVVSGKAETADLFCSILERQTRKLMLSLGRNLPRPWDINISEIDNLEYVRKAISYLCRNPYVAASDFTPLGYRWSGAYLLFNQHLDEINTGTPWLKALDRTKREICRSHDTDLPKQYFVRGGAITRESYIDYRLAEAMFNSARQFFLFLSRRGEADIEIAGLTGESILLPNDEVYSIVRSWFDVKSLQLLDINQRTEAARRMKSSLRSNNKQISQILRLPMEAVERMFP